jgi:signal peptidase II
MSLLMGGAAGNVWDRVQLGEVVDFIQVHGNWLSLVFAGGFFPSFNVADSAISVGVVLMLVDEWRHARQFQGAEKDSA